MPIQNIGLTTSTAASPSIGIRIVDGNGSVTPYLSFSTLYGTDVHSQFKVSFRWRGIPKGGTGGSSDGYGSWSAWKETSLSPSSCNPRQEPNSDQWWWYIPLSTLISNVSSVNGGSWSYGNRVYDQVQFSSQITTVAPFGGGWPDETGYSESLWIGNFPKYSVTDIYMQGDWLVITYDAPGWTRKDDRWEILNFEKMNGGHSTGVIRPGAWGSQAGRVEKLGWITIPSSSLSSLIQSGDRLYLRIRWNAAYRPIGLDFADWSGYINVSDNGTANTPTGDVTINPDGSIGVDLGDSGTGGGVINSWQVTIEGGGTEFDNVNASGISPSALLKYPPLDKEVIIQIQGSTATGGTSDVIEKRVFIPSDGIALIDPIDSTGARIGEQIRTNANVEVSTDGKRDQEVVKFAGRSRPSVAFGTGGTADVDVKWWIPRNRREFAPEDPLKDARDAGLCVIRVPGGGRWLVAIDSASVGEAYDHPDYSECEISGQEVV